MSRARTRAARALDSTTHEVARAVVCAALLACTACAGDAQDGGCRADADCEPGAACIATTCVPRLSTPSTFAVEMVPAGSGGFMPVELPQQSFGSAPVTIAADRRAVLKTTLAPDPTDRDFVADPQAQLQIIISAAALIPGRPERQYETQATPFARGEPFLLSVPLPERLLERSVVLRALPRPPLDRSMPPVEMPLLVRSNLPEVRLPSAADALFVEGKLEKADGTAATDYVARAVRGGQVVSNAPLTAGAGTFKVRIPKIVGRDALAGLRLDLTPAQPERPWPNITLATIAEDKLNVGTLRLPAFPEPAMFSIPIVSAPGAGSDVRIAWARVRFQTTLPGAGGGAVATFVREAQTDANGVAQMALLPGEAERPRLYDVRVIPPEGSPYAARCVAGYGVASGTSGVIRVGASIALPSRAVLNGRITDSAGRVVEGVRLRTTRIVTANKDEGAPSERCEADLLSPPSFAASEADGRYRLALDPGEYRVEFEPATGGPHPLYALDAVAVQTSVTLDVTLPAGRVIEARTAAPNGAPLPGTTVRLFEVLAGRAVLRGQSASDAGGLVRIVIPAAR